jgi:hypothetical protein
MATTLLTGTSLDEPLLHLQGRCGDQ